MSEKEKKESLKDIIDDESKAEIEKIEEKIKEPEKEPEPEPEPEIDGLTDFSLDESISEIEERAPEVSEHVFEANKENFSNETPSDTGNEQQFDSSIHRSDEEGKPILTKGGKLWKKSGRKKGGTVSSLGSVPEKSPEEIQGEMMNQQNEGVALVAANAAKIIRHKLGVKKPEKADEKEIEKMEVEYLKDSLKTFLNETGLIVNPNVGLIIASVTFFLPVFLLPPDKNVLLKFALKLIGKKKKKTEIIEEPEIKKAA